MNKKDAAKVLAVLKAAYPNYKIDNAEALAKIWEINLAEYPPEIVMSAAMIHIGRSKYFPSMPEIKECIQRALILNDMQKLEACTQVKKLEGPKNGKDDGYYLEQLCKFVGLGCDPDDNADLGEYFVN